MLAKLPDFRLSLLGKELTPASSVKDLGVKFDPTLSFNDHILSIEICVLHPPFFCVKNVLGGV